MERLLFAPCTVKQPLITRNKIWCKHQIDTACSGIRHSFQIWQQALFCFSLITPCSGPCIVSYEPFFIVFADLFLWSFWCPKGLVHPDVCTISSCPLPHSILFYKLQLTCQYSSRFLQDSSRLQWCSLCFFSPCPSVNESRLYSHLILGQECKAQRSFQKL